MAEHIDTRLGISVAAKKVQIEVAASALQAKDLATRMAENSGLHKHADEIKDVIKTYVANPSAELIKRHELDKDFKKFGSTLEHSYGVTRSAIKPYFAAESSTDCYSTPEVSWLIFLPASCKLAQMKLPAWRGNLVQPSPQK